MSSQGLAAIIVLVVSFALGATANDETAKPVTCTAVHDGVKHTAQVTCHFSSDVSSLVPVSLSVEFYPEGQNDSSVSVAECIWEADHDGCQVKVGKFSFSRSPASAGPGDMVLHIDDVTGNDAGRYVCQQMSTKGSRTPSLPCVLSVEGPGHEVTTITSDDHSGKAVSDSSAVTGGTDKEEDGMDMTTLLPAILIPAVLLVIAVIVAVLLWRKRRQSRGDLTGGRTDEEEALSRPSPDSDDPNATGKPADEALNATEIPEKAAPNTTEIPEKEALNATETPEKGAPNSTEMPEKEAPDSTKTPEPQEDEKGTSEGDPLVVVTDKGFEHERETKPV